MIIRAPADWNGPDWQTQLEALCDKSLLAPFDPIALSFADRLSKRILLDKRMRSYPEMMALAHWLRKGNQAELIHSFEQRHQGSLLRPRGVVLHFAPANVDTIFVYSFMISLLCGNSNIVRVSSTPNEQIDLLIGLLNELLEEEAFIPLKERICILTYAHNDAITSKLSQLCAVRVIWGGDETVRKIRAVPLPPMATELTFANRFSFSVLSANAIEEAAEAEMDRLVQQFYNDCYWFQQMACSSPRLVFWIGESGDIKNAKIRFWGKLEQLLKSKHAELSPALYVSVLTTAYYYSTLDSVLDVSVRPNGLPIRVDSSSLDGQMRNSHGGGGLFLEADAEELKNIIDRLQTQDQTMTYYGFSRDQLEQFVSLLPGRQVDRIVPVGAALDFAPHWDGFDLFAQFTRNVHLLIR